MVHMSIVDVYLVLFSVMLAVELTDNQFHTRPTSTLSSSECNIGQ
jgi:hypothetical protein